MMRVVLDTNILVSGLLTPGGKSARILAMMLNGTLLPLFDAAILAEYRMVLGRKKFSFEMSGIAALMDYLESEGELVTADSSHVSFVDEADRKFYEVALTGHAACLITGNSAHFPVEPLIMTPKNFLTQYHFTIF